MGVYGIEAVQITGCGSDAARSRVPADAAAAARGGACVARVGPSVQKASCAITFLAAALRMMLPRAASELEAVAANVTLRLLLMMATGCAPGTRTPCVTHVQVKDRRNDDLEIHVRGRPSNAAPGAPICRCDSAPVDIGSNRAAELIKPPNVRCKREC